MKINCFVSGLRLRMTSVPLATASVIYHKFFRENSLQQYDPYVRKISLTLFQNYFISSVLGINNMFNLTSKLRHSEIQFFLLWILCNVQPETNASVWIVANCNNCPISSWEGGGTTLKAKRCGECLLQVKKTPIKPAIKLHIPRVKETDTMES